MFIQMFQVNENLKVGDTKSSYVFIYNSIKMFRPV